MSKVKIKTKVEVKESNYSSSYEESDQKVSIENLNISDEINNELQAL